MPEHYYDTQFRRTSKKTGKWRGKLASLYTKYVRVKKILPQPFVETFQGKPTITVPKEYKERPEVLVWEKIIYQAKLS